MTDAELGKVPGTTEVAVAQLDSMRRANYEPGARSGLEGCRICRITRRI
jgi:hypothetical protein